MALCAFCNHSREFQLNIQALDPIFLRHTDRSKNSDKKHRIGLEEKLKQSTLDNISIWNLTQSMCKLKYSLALIIEPPTKCIIANESRFNHPQLTIKK